jgi:phosphoglycerol transferase
MITLNLIALLLASIVIISVFRNKYIRVVLATIFGVFFVLEVSSLYLGSSFIDYKYYQHFNFNALLMAGGFKKEIAFVVLLLTSVPTLLFFVSRPRFPQSKKRRIIIKSTAFVAAMLVLTASTNGVFSKLKEIYSILSTPVTSDFSVFLNSADISEDKQLDTLNLEAPKTDSSKLDKQNAAPIIFTRKENLRAKFGGKNIVIISLESFEKAFLHDTNKHLTPNLRRRAQQWPFYEMKQNHGSIWTAGSLYTVLTGSPSFFVGHINDYFYGAKKSKLINLCDILSRGGYEQYHLSNDATFAGTRDILTTFGIDHIVDGESIMVGREDKCPFGGAWDKDVFDKAKDVVHQTDSIHKPFMLWISTIQTHHTDGVVDDRMLEFVEKQETNLETAALSTDWLVEDFLSFLEQRGLMKNTVVYLFPDHLFMQNKKIFDKTNEPRSLWLMTNADEKDLHIDSSNFYQIDIIGNILSGAKIKHNAKFLADFINEDKNEFINKNVKLITAINSASIIREQILSESFCLNLNMKNKTLTCLMNRDTLFVLDIDSVRHAPVYLLLNKALKIISIRHTNNEIYDYCYSYIKISIKDTHICFDWIRDDAYTYHQQSASEIRIDNEQIASIVTSIMPNEVNSYSVADYFSNGVVEYAPTIKDSILIEYLSVILEDSSKVVMMSCCDDASIYFGKLRPVFSKTGLKESLEGKFRWSYLAAFSNHEVYCEKAADSVALHKRFTIGDIPIYLASNGWNSYAQPYNAQHIVINSQEYSLGKRGLNVAIFDTKSRKVIDSFNVDFYGDETLTIVR